MSKEVWQWWILYVWRLKIWRETTHSVVKSEWMCRKEKWAKKMNFIVRLSVNFTLFSIVSSERQQKIAEEFFAALFLRVENDRKIGCRRPIAATLRTMMMNYSRTWNCVSTHHLNTSFSIDCAIVYEIFQLRPFISYKRYEKFSDSLKLPYAHVFVISRWVCYYTRIDIWIMYERKR